MPHPGCPSYDWCPLTGALCPTRVRFSCASYSTVCSRILSATLEHSQTVSQTSGPGTKQKIVPTGERHSTARPSGLCWLRNTVSLGTEIQIDPTSASYSSAEMRYDTGRQSAIVQHEAPLPGRFSDSNHGRKAGSASAGGSALVDLNSIFWARVEVAWWICSFLSVAVAAAQFEDKLAAWTERPCRQ